MSLRFRKAALYFFVISCLNTSLRASSVHPELRRAVPRAGCLYIYISEVQLSFCWCVSYSKHSAGWTQRTLEQSCNQTSNYRPAATTGGPEQSGRMKTGQEKPGRHYNHTQSCGRAGKEGKVTVPVQKELIRERFTRKTRGLVKACLIHQGLTVMFNLTGSGTGKMCHLDFAIYSKNHPFHYFRYVCSPC